MGTPFFVVFSAIGSHRQKEDHHFGPRAGILRFAQDDNSFGWSHLASIRMTRS